MKIIVCSMAAFLFATAAYSQQLEWRGSYSNYATAKSDGTRIHIDLWLDPKTNQTVGQLEFKPAKSKTTYPGTLHAVDYNDASGKILVEGFFRVGDKSYPIHLEGTLQNNEFDGKVDYAVPSKKEPAVTMSENMVLDKKELTFQTPDPKMKNIDKQSKAIENLKRTEW